MIYFKKLGNYGRLGNQLFQIATTYALALENSDEAIFPIWEYNEYLIGIKTDDVENFKITYEYVEGSHNYYKPPYINGMNLSGYFQSEKYFENFEKEIKKIFKLKEKYEIELKDKWKEQLKNSCSIHVRRDDYVQSEGIGGIHVTPKMDYFISSLNYIESLNKIDNILVFSDDIQWCKENFFDSRCIFVENQKDVLDLFLMSFCNHNITTNSSFSWWASWLNENKNRIITSPRKWFNTSESFWKDTYHKKQMIF